MTYHWRRTLYNGYEPENRIRFSADDQRVPFAVTGLLTFNDGHCYICIERQDDGSFSWRNGDQVGIADSFEDAWEHLPAFVTNPDHYLDSEIKQSMEGL